MPTSPLSINFDSISCQKQRLGSQSRKNNHRIISKPHAYEGHSKIMWTSPLTAHVLVQIPHICIIHNLKLWVSPKKLGLILSNLVNPKKRAWHSNYHSNITAGQESFVEFLKGIMLNIFIKNKTIHLCICINVEQQYLSIFPEICYSF